MFAAAHDFKTEWVVVKGIKDFADGSQSSNEKWEYFASVMAASVVANILSDPVIFQDWPHYNEGIAFCLNTFSFSHALYSTLSSVLGHCQLLSSTALGFLMQYLLAEADLISAWKYYTYMHCTCTSSYSSMYHKAR